MGNNTMHSSVEPVPSDCSAWGAEMPDAPDGPPCTCRQTPPCWANGVPAEEYDLGSSGHHFRSRCRPGGVTGCRSRCRGFHGRPPIRASYPRMAKRKIHWTVNGRSGPGSRAGLNRDLQKDPGPCGRESERWPRGTRHTRRAARTLPRSSTRTASCLEAEGGGDQAIPAPPAASREQEATVGRGAEWVRFLPLDHESRPTLIARSRASSRVERGPSSRSKVIWRAYPLKRIVSGADSYACRRVITAASLSSLPYCARATSMRWRARRDLDGIAA